MEAGVDRGGFSLQMRHPNRSFVDESADATLTLAEAGLSGRQEALFLQPTMDGDADGDMHMSGPSYEPSTSAPNPTTSSKAHVHEDDATMPDAPDVPFSGPAIVASAALPPLPSSGTAGTGEAWAAAAKATTCAVDSMIAEDAAGPSAAAALLASEPALAASGTAKVG